MKATPPLVARKLPSTRDLMAPEDASPVLYEDEYEKRNASLQLSWSALMEDGPYKTSSFYKKVKCLLISWDNDCDDLHTETEVGTIHDSSGAKLMELGHQPAACSRRYSPLPSNQGSSQERSRSFSTSSSSEACYRFPMERRWPQHTAARVLRWWVKIKLSAIGTLALGKWF